MAKKNLSESPITEKLDALFNLQQIDSTIDKIRTVRGELPLEVVDLEAEVEGLTSRLDNLVEESKLLETEISNRKNAIKESKEKIKKYLEQQKNVRNNREYDSITKEIEFQGLEVELNEKKIKEASFKIESKQEVLEAAKEKLEERKKDLEIKKKDLADIVSETEDDEQKLLKKSEKARSIIEPRLLGAYDRLRTNSINGLAVVKVERNSCGGCFNQIPPQRQLDIMARKKIIICEHCGRILIEPNEN